LMGPESKPPNGEATTPEEALEIPKREAHGFSSDSNPDAEPEHPQFEATRNGETQDTFRDSVQRLKKVWESTRTHWGDQSAKKIFPGARQAAAGIIYPEESYQTLKLYQTVEKEIFGELGPLHPGEQDLTEDVGN
jgi:hypothetical protein